MFRKIIFALGILAGILAILSLVVYLSPTPKYAAQNPDIKVIATESAKAEGKRIALTICVRCHYNENTNSLSGKQHGNPKRLGEFSSGNITRDSATGIGAWSSGQLYYFLKTGVKPDGDYVFDMPKYPNLSEEDLTGIIAFLQSDDSLVRKTNSPNPKPRFSFLTKLLLRTMIRPPSFNDKKVSAPDTGNTVEFGKYLATAKFSCYECHSLNMVSTDYNNPEKSWGFFEGGNPHANEEGQKIYTPNISGDSVKGIGKWSKQQFIRTLINGIKPDGTSVKDPMFPFYLLTDREAESIYVYLKSISH
jgi:mono/diheme cytochrome c family protein